MIARGDDRSVGDRVGIRDADLDQVRPAVDQLVDQRGRGGQVGVAGGDERHQAGLVLFLQPREKGVDSIHVVEGPAMPNFRCRGEREGSAHSGDRLAPEPGDLVGVLVAPAGQADHEHLARCPAGGLP